MALKNPVINTVEDLRQYILSEPSIYANIPERVKNNLSGEIQTVILIIDYALRQGLLSVNEIQQLISFDTCNEEILHAWCDMWNIPLPRFPKESHARVHVQQAYTPIIPPDWGSSYVTPCYVADDYVFPEAACSPLIFEYGYQFTHNLGTPNYVFKIVLFDGTNKFIVNVEDYFDLVQVNPNQLILYRNTPLSADNLYIDRVLFIYHKDYLEGKRLIARNAVALDGMRYTVAGTEYYLKLLLHNTATINITASSNIAVILQCLRFDANSDNLNNCRLLLFNGPDISVFDPKIFPGSQFASTKVSIDITTDLQKDIAEFIQNAVINYFTPFKTVLGKNVTFIFHDNTIDWIKNEIWPIP